MRQILSNLVGNAVKFTHNGFVEIRVTCNNDPLESRVAELTFEIQDTGIGNI